MNILVCINQVPDTTAKINFTEDFSKIDLTGVQFILNPADESALIKAIQFKEKYGASVTILHLGKSDSEPVLRKSFALGVDKMVRLDAEPTDGFFVANAIFDYVKNNSFDLIFCGKESLDYHGGMVGGMLATLLNINFIDDVISISLEEKSALVAREIENGKETLSASFPLLVAVQKELISESELRIPNMRNIMAARTAPIDVISVENYEILTKISSFEKPAPKAPIQMIDANNLDALVEILKPMIKK